MRFKGVETILTDREVALTGLSSPIPLRADVIMNELAVCYNEYILLADMRHDEQFLGLEQQELFTQEMSKLNRRDKILIRMARHLIDRDLATLSSNEN